MIKLSEEGVLKAEISQELSLLYQTIIQAVSANGKLLKEIQSAAPVNIGMIRKWNNLFADMEKVLASG